MNVKPAGGATSGTQVESRKMSGAISSTVFPSGSSSEAGRPCDRCLITIASFAAAHIGRVPHRRPLFAAGRWSRRAAAASARLRTPSLFRMPPTWCSAVLGEMNSFPAMSALL